MIYTRMFVTSRRLEALGTPHREIRVRSVLTCRCVYSRRCGNAGLRMDCCNCRCAGDGDTAINSGDNDGNVYSLSSVCTRLNSTAFELKRLYLRDYHTGSHNPNQSARQEPWGLKPQCGMTGIRRGLEGHRCGTRLSEAQDRKLH